MKSTKTSSYATSSSTPSPSSSFNGVKAVVIRKNPPEHIILDRLRQYLLYSKLRSLLPPQPAQERGSESIFEAATEMELEFNEIPHRDSEEEEVTNNAFHISIKEDDEDGNVVYQSDEEETSKLFIPSIKIKKMEGSILINTIVLKDACLTSGLFRILEEEKLDIVFENQYRTETKVAHTIQVNLQSDYSVDALERRLCNWARNVT